MLRHVRPISAGYEYNPSRRSTYISEEQYYNVKTSRFLGVDSYRKSTTLYLLLNSKIVIHDNTRVEYRDVIII